MYDQPLLLAIRHAGTACRFASPALIWSAERKITLA
jgi:hypothetical protein